MSSFDSVLSKVSNEGIRSLSTSELFELILHMPKGGKRLAEELLHKVGGRLSEFLLWQASDFMRWKPITLSKGVLWMAVWELSRRLRDEQEVVPVHIQVADDAYALMHAHMKGLTQEEFWILMLNHSSVLLSKRCLFRGGLHALTVDLKTLFRTALGHPACTKMVLVHNHPSGSCNPSMSDIRITERMVEMGRSLDLQVLDHLIYTDREYFSFAERGLLR